MEHSVAGVQWHDLSEIMFECGVNECKFVTHVLLAISAYSLIEG